MSEDLIRRQAAINTVFSMCCRWNTSDSEDLKNMLLTAFQDLPSAEPRWIPVVERLPLKPGFYLVTVGAPYKPVRVYEYNPCEGYENENLWKGEDGAYVFNWFVETWQNLPEPWKGEDDETD